ncbi:MAG TPA: ATP-binding protein, partial [Bacteroidales bacterium]
ENEREKVEKQKIEIEKQNKEIQEKNAELEEKQEEINAQKEKILLQKAELEEINRELILIDEMKSSFFTNISHEFRTPLTLIMGPLESLLENTTDKKLAAEYSLMLRHSERLFLLINQLLDISKIEKGKMQLVLKEANMNTAIRTITSSFEPFASDKGISIYLEEKDNDIRAFFDADKLEKILYNLLSNAFKFTEKDGKIEVQIQRSANKKNVEITVKDNGIGIQAEKLPHIFDRFYQVEENKSHQYGDGGTGIGLALTKELVTLHEGTIEVSSIPGSGTTFKISLPIDKTSYTGENITFKDEELEAKISGLLNAPNYMPEPGNIPVNKPSDNRKTILIVEDNPDMRTHLVKSISNRYHLEEASNGEDGIQKAVDLQPDLILSDIMMPGVDGLRLTLAIKENPLTSHIPVIILTAKADEESKLEGLLLHADDYITKPFRMKELMARINSQIVNREKLRDKFKKTITVVPSEITTSSLDEQFLQKVLNIIEKNMSNPAFSVDDLCREMSMSRTNIHLKLKAITNQSTTEFIRSIRLKRAAQLIRQKAGNTGEIADMTGFSNPQYFSRCFKEYFKVSPSEY